MFAPSILEIPKTTPEYIEDHQGSKEAKGPSYQLFEGPKFFRTILFS